MTTPAPDFHAAAIGEQRTSPWLFPGGQPSWPISREMTPMPTPDPATGTALVEAGTLVTDGHRGFSRALAGELLELVHAIERRRRAHGEQTPAGRRPNQEPERDSSRQHPAQSIRHRELLLPCHRRRPRRQPASNGIQHCPDATQEPLHVVDV
jgi:hypothetical protein